MEVVYKAYGASFLLLVLFLVVMVRPYIRKMRSRNKIIRIPIINEYDKHLRLNKLIAPYGFAYDRRQNIFYSTGNAFRPADELPLNMIFEYEPIYFDYKGKNWKIEFLKGQCFICIKAGVLLYYREYGRPYQFIKDEDTPKIQFALWKNGKKLFDQKGYHCCLSGFVMGGFANPAKLKMQIEITFENDEMKAAFINGLCRAGYKEDEITTDKNTVAVLFHRPKSSRCYVQRKPALWIRQLENRCCYIRYKIITKNYDNSYDKLLVLKEKAPELFDKVVESERKCLLERADGRYCEK